MKKLFVLLLSFGLLFAAKNAQNDSCLDSEMNKLSLAADAANMYSKLDLSLRQRAFAPLVTYLIGLGYARTINNQSNPPIHQFTMTFYCSSHQRSATHTIALPEPQD